MTDTEHRSAKHKLAAERESAPAPKRHVKPTTNASRPMVRTQQENSLDAHVAFPYPNGDNLVASTEQSSLRIGDVAARVGVSTRTLRYYEELGILSPSDYTPGGERRYRPQDLHQLERILELKELLGMNLDEIKETLASQVRLEELRAAYREHNAVESRAARARQRMILVEALELRTDLIARMDEKLAKMADFRAHLHSDAERCRALLAESELDNASEIATKDGSGTASSR